MVHTSHTEVINRLKRAHGHLNKILTMLESEQDCLKCAQQLSAVEKAVANAKKVLIQDHVDHCLERSLMDPKGVDDRRALLNEFKEITKYL